MTTENTISSFSSDQEYADAIVNHRTRLEQSYDHLPPQLADLAQEVRIRSREVLDMSTDDFVVFLGEQTYGLSGRDKVLGKRVFGKALERRHGISVVEYFAASDHVGSEPDIYRMQLPHTQKSGGFVSINVLSGWRKKKTTQTSGFRSPTPEELSTVVGQIKGLYPGVRIDDLERFMGNFYMQDQDYATANTQMLREFEKQIGLQIEKHVHDGEIDTIIASNGGMEVALSLWNPFIEEAQKHPINGVRIPQKNEAPLFLFHDSNPDCNSKMIGNFLDEDQGPKMDSQMSIRCTGCRHTETSSPQEIVDSGRQLAFRAMPRVLLYSSTGIFDGHVAGGGSIYNAVVHQASEGIGVPYYPVSSMDKRNGNGEKRGIFNYRSYTTSKNGSDNHPHHEEAVNFVREGRASMVDLVLSLGVENLREAVEDTIDREITTATRISCSKPLYTKDALVFG